MPSGPRPHPLARALGALVTGPVAVFVSWLIDVAVLVMARLTRRT